MGVVANINAGRAGAEVEVVDSRVCLEEDATGTGAGNGRNTASAGGGVTLVMTCGRGGSEGWRGGGAGLSTMIESDSTTSTPRIGVASCRAGVEIAVGRYREGVWDGVEPGNGVGAAAES